MPIDCSTEKTAAASVDELNEPNNKHSTSDRLSNPTPKNPRTSAVIETPIGDRIKPSLTMGKFGSILHPDPRKQDQN